MVEVSLIITDNDKGTTFGIKKDPIGKATDLEHAIGNIARLAIEETIRIFMQSVGCKDFTLVEGTSSGVAFDMFDKMKDEAKKNTQ